jgi:hypothetical protein
MPFTDLGFGQLEGPEGAARNVEAAHLAER